MGQICPNHSQLVNNVSPPLKMLTTTTPQPQPTCKQCTSTIDVNLAAIEMGCWMLAKLAVRFRQLADMLHKEARALNTLPGTSRVITCMASRRSRPTSGVDQQLLHGLVHPVLGQPAQDRVPPPSPAPPLTTSLKKRRARGRGLSGRGGKYLGNLGNLGISTLLNDSLSLRRPEGLSHFSTLLFLF